MRLHANSKAIQHLSPDVISVPKDALQNDPFVILESGKNRERYDFYRSNGTKVVMIRKLPGQLPEDAIRAINKECDTHECAKNHSVKTILRDALSVFFNNKAIHINEAGPGQFPIMSYFPANSGITFHGIEKDEDHINTLKTKMNLSASKWEDVPPLPEDGKPSVGVAVYALQFMVSRELPAHLKSILSNDGFFVGNMYLNPNEKDSHKQSDFLANTLRASKMGFVRLKDPDCSANEYWIISKTNDLGPIEKFKDTLSAVLASQLLQARNRSLNFH